MDTTTKKRLLAVRAGIRWLEEEADGLQFLSLSDSFKEGVLFADAGALRHALMRVEIDIDQIIESAAKAQERKEKANA